VRGRRVTPAAVAVGGLAVGTATALAIGLRWNRATRRAVRRLGLTETPPALPTHFAADELAGLPTPVARYFELALTPGQPLVRRARIVQRGSFALRPGSWRSMRAVQHISIAPPGFVWSARIATAGMLGMRVRDEYFHGRSAMRAALEGVVPLVDRRDTPGLAEGALLRYLAEAASVPTALLPSAGVRWTPLDDRSARATLTDAGLTVSMDAHFGPGGEITHVTAQRYREVDGAGVATPFVGRWGDYRRIDGMLVPHASEALWLLPEGSFAFWRGHVAGVDYEFASVEARA
jgi:hypothetical protein